MEDELETTFRTFLTKLDEQFEYYPPKKKLKYEDDEHYLIKKDINEKSKMEHFYIKELLSSSDDEKIIEKKKPQCRRSLYTKNNRVMPSEMMISGQHFVANSEKLFTKIINFDNNSTETTTKEIAHKGVQCNLIENNYVEPKKNDKFWDCFKFFKRK